MLINGNNTNFVFPLNYNYNCVKQNNGYKNKVHTYYVNANQILTCTLTMKVYYRLHTHMDITMLLILIIKYIISIYDKY